MMRPWSPDEWVRSSIQQPNFKTVKDGLPPVWLDKPDDVKLVLWHWPSLAKQTTSSTAQQSSFSSFSKGGAIETVIYTKEAVVGHFSPYLKTLICNYENANAPPHSSVNEALLICTCDSVTGEQAEEEGVDVLDQDLHPRTTPCQCGCQKAAVGCDGAEVAVGGGMKIVYLEVEGALHMSAAMALLHSMYTSHVPPGLKVTPKIWLLMLQMAVCWQFARGEDMCSNALCRVGLHELPTIEVYEMSRTAPKTFCKCPDVLAVASKCLRIDFGDAHNVLGTPSLLKRFLKLHYTLVLVLMDQFENTCYAQESRVELFETWCISRAGTESVAELCTLTAAFPLTEVYSLMPQIQRLPCFSNVMQAAIIQLHLKYGDASEIVASPALLKSFCALPQPAVLVWLKSDELVADDEVTVMLIVDAWLESGWYSTQDFIELRSAIRYSCLPLPYLTGQQIHRPSKLSASSAMEVLHNVASGDCPIYTDNPGWYFPSRAPSPSKDRSQASLNLKVSVEELLDLLKNDGSRSCPYVYAAGYLWRLSLNAEDNSVWYGIEVLAVTSLKNLQEGVFADREISCCCALEIVKPSAAGSPTPQALLAGERSIFHSKDGYCLANSVDGLSPFDPKWWAAYTQNGHVQFSAAVYDINP